jgi:hypothetical protein
MAGNPLRNADIARLRFCTPQQASEIWDAINSGLSIRNAAMELGYTYSALSDWLNDPARAELLKRARARAAAHLAEETLGIADNGADTSAPDAARDKLRIQARQWLASKWDRASWGQQSGTSLEVNVSNLYLGAMRSVQPGDSAVVIEATAEPGSD